MDRDYYKQYYKLERTHWWFIVREKILYYLVKRHFNIPKKIKILNIGVATGRTSEMLLKFGDVTSVEYDKECCKIMHELTGLNVINASITELPFSESTFDLVCAFDVIEHVDEDKKAVLEMNRVCKENGIIFLTVPAFEFIWSKHDDINQHKRRYNISQLRKLFLKQELQGKILRTSYFNFILFLPIVFTRLLEKLLPKTKKDYISSDFDMVNNNLLNKLFYLIFKIEVPLLQILNFPFGISIFYLWKKSIKN